MNSPSSWAEVGAAFDELAGLPILDRALQLENIKKQNPPLAEELFSLLLAHDKADGFFEERVPRIFGSMAPGLNLEPGERLLHFEIVELLGEGSLSKVYLARDTELERLIALKVTLNQSKEARTLAHFSLDGIIQVHSEHVVEHSGVLLRLMCLQFVAGPTLAKLTHELRANPGHSIVELLEKSSQREVAFEPSSLKWRELLNSLSQAEGIALIGMRLAEILSHAHALGVLHLDIKPANILIDAYGRPHLSDFNVSAHTNRLSSGDVRGMGGTPHYMPPEQARFFESRNAAKATDLDQRCDVYALGVVLRDLMLALNTTDHPLQKILNRATEPDTTQRTSSAKILAQELRAWLRSQLAEKEMPKLWAGFRWICRHPLVGLISLTIFSQLAASVINISYNQLQIVSVLTPYQNQIFMNCVMVYNLITYPITNILAIYAMRALFTKSASQEWARKTGLRIPFIVFAAISFGWLPGAYLFPWMIDYFAGPLDPSIYWQFAGSFYLSWLISLTTSLAVSMFVLARALYPKYWQGQTELAVKELNYCERLNRYLTCISALVPMAGVLLIALMAPSEYSMSNYRILLLVVVGFGLLNLLLVQRLTQSAASAFAALKRPRSFD